MLLTVAYINEVLNQHPSDVVFTPEVYAKVCQAFHLSPTSETAPVVSRLTLRSFPGGYSGMLEQLATMTQQRDELAQKVAELTSQLEVATAPVHA